MRLARRGAPCDPIPPRHRFRNLRAQELFRGLYLRRGGVARQGGSVLPLGWGVVGFVFFFFVFHSSLTFWRRQSSARCSRLVCPIFSAYGIGNEFGFVLIGKTTCRAVNTFSPGCFVAVKREPFGF